MLTEVRKVAGTTVHESIDAVNGLNPVNGVANGAKIAVVSAVNFLEDPVFLTNEMPELQIWIQ